MTSAKFSDLCAPSPLPLPFVIAPLIRAITYVCMWRTPLSPPRRTSHVNNPSPRGKGKEAEGARNGEIACLDC